MSDEMSDKEWEDYKAETCYECTGYGNDYYEDANGEFVSACSECWINAGID